MPENVNDASNIYFNFSYLALKLLGKGLYSNPWAALSELIANGIDAQAKKIFVLLDLSDKKAASIEILDDGGGMDYSDIATKYVWVGRDKRKDPTEKHSLPVMGRKGIGKLAALFLSNDYFICSKKAGNTELWHLGLSDERDSDFPKLQKVSCLADVNSTLGKTFAESATGTLIKLNDVDLSKVGEQTISALSARFGAFFLSDNITTKIYIGLKKAESEIPAFEEVKKTIGFRNLVAYFSNIGSSLDSKLSQNVRFDTKTEIAEVRETLYPITRLDPSRFSGLSGTFETLINGKTVKKSYSLKGWIGIHATITSSAAQRNDPSFIRNNVYTPNKLRLYVRNKLAQENFLDVIQNTQAFANYIEGEISFDLLDDDDLADIATSSRQGFDESDPRITLLKEIVAPIVQALIRTRLHYADIVKEQIEAFYRAERKSRDERIALEKAAKEKAQAEAAALGDELKNANEEVAKEKELNEYLTKVSELSKRDAITVIHSLYTYSSLINKEFYHLTSIYSKIDFKEKSSLQKISKMNSECYILSKGIIKGGFRIEDEKVRLDLFDFALDYSKSGIAQAIKDRMDISVEKLSEESFVMEISPTHFACILENIISNSFKANATKLNVLFKRDGEYQVLRFEDNGDGLNQKIKDINDIFRFGITTTDGGGVGLYFVKQYFEKSGAQINPQILTPNGLCLEIRWKETTTDEESNNESLNN